MSIVFLQSAGAESAAGATAVAVAFPADVSRGNLLVACCATGANDILVSHVTDSLGNAYLAGSVWNSFGMAVGIFYCFSTGSGPCTVTLDVGTDTMALAVGEFAGVLDTGSTINIQSSGPFSASGLKTIALPLWGDSVSPLRSGIMVGGIVSNGQTIGFDSSSPSGARPLFEINKQDGAVFSFSAYWVKKSAGPASISWQISVPTDGAMVSLECAGDGTDPTFPSYATFPPFGGGR